MNYSIKTQIYKNTVFALVMTFIIYAYCTCIVSLFNKIEKTNTVAVGAEPAERKCIVIDPGHGGEDGGAVGVNGVLEKDLNLSVSSFLGDILRFSGYEVVQTRSEDKLLYDPDSDYKGKKKILDLKGRLEIAQNTNPDIFVGIHMNAFPEQKYSGLSIYYSKNNPQSHIAAEVVQSNVKTTLQPQNNREIKAANSNIYILNRILCPAILIECGFLTNPIECEKLSTNEYRQELSFVFYSSIVSFLEK